MPTSVAGPAAAVAGLAEGKDNGSTYRGLRFSSASHQRACALQKQNKYMSNGF